MNLEKLFTAKAAKERKGKQGTSLVVKITNVVIASKFALALISLASLSVLGGSNAGFWLNKHAMPTVSTPMVRFLPALAAVALLSADLYAGSGVAASNASSGSRSAAAPQAQAPSYPYRPVRLIVLFPPGGSDTVARMLGQKLSEKLGQQLVIDNRAGAAGTIGANIAAKAAADGYTLLFATASFAMTAGFYRNLPYDPVRDFAAIGSVASQPFLLVAHPSLPTNTVKELVALAKAKPDQLIYGSTGAGAAGHLATEMFISMTGIRITHVPYKGTGPAITAVIAGEVPFVFAVIGSALPSVRAGKLKALAVTSVRRSALAPDLPTVAESGVPGYEAVTWFGILAPRGTPQSIIGLLNGEIVAVLRSNDFHDRLVAMGIEPVVSTPKEFADFLQTEIAKWGKVIRDAGIRAE